MASPVARVLVYVEEYRAIAEGRRWVLCPLKVAPPCGPIDIVHATEPGKWIPLRRVVEQQTVGRGIDRDWCLLTLMEFL